MRPLQFALLTVLAVSSAACAQSPSRRGGPSADPPPPAFSAADVERAVHRATNDARRERGLAALAWEDGLVRAARAHSADMGERGYFAHETPEGRTPTDRAAATDMACRTHLGGGLVREGVAENLFSGYAHTGYEERTGPGGTRRTYRPHSAVTLARAVVDGWLRSPGHRRNLLDREHRREAIGVWIGRDGRVLVTQSLC